MSMFLDEAVWNRGIASKLVSWDIEYAKNTLRCPGLLAYVVDKRYFRAAAFAGALAVSSFIGMIHAESVSLFSPVGVAFGVVYLLAGAFLVGKGICFPAPKTPIDQPSPEEKTAAETKHTA